MLQIPVIQNEAHMQKYDARRQRVRVLRPSPEGKNAYFFGYDEDGNINHFEPYEWKGIGDRPPGFFQTSVAVVFNGSEKAYAIWRMVHDLRPGDILQQYTTGGDVHESVVQAQPPTKRVFKKGK